MDAQELETVLSQSGVFLPEKAIGVLHEILAPDESVFVAAEGYLNNRPHTVLATDRRLLTIQGGFRKFNWDDIFYADALSIGTKGGLRSAKLLVETAAGYYEWESLKPKENVQQIVAVANEWRVRAKAGPAHQPDSPPSPPSTADELAKLSQLHEQGALSDEEFAAAKSALLGSPPTERGPATMPPPPPSADDKLP